MVDAINQFSQICPGLVAVGRVSVYGRIDAGIMPPLSAGTACARENAKDDRVGRDPWLQRFFPNGVGEICLM